MNEQERVLFDKLHDDRLDSARVFNKPDNKGIKEVLTDKYSDNAHFVYELLQNADDVQATYVKFVLKKDELVFIHNGTRHFSVTDVVKAVQEDFIQGDINAITAVGNSNKKDEATIGKFGIGFKAVFKYTDTPCIYDRNFRFKIEQLIVPYLLKEDYPGRQEEETVFVFPFNSSKITAEVAYEEIATKLESLHRPILFLSHLKKIEYIINDNAGTYEKKLEQAYAFDNTTAEMLLLQSTGSEAAEERLLVFSRCFEDKFTCSVGFAVKNGELQPIKDEDAYCYFPTKERTKLDFIIQAPFLLTNSREGIVNGNEHNINMIAYLSTLAADAIVYMKNISNGKNGKLLDDNILNIIPLKSNYNYFRGVDSVLQSKTTAFCDKLHDLTYYKVKEKFQNEQIIPTLDGYCYIKDVFVTKVGSLLKLLSNAQLAVLSGNDNAQWGFVNWKNKVLNQEQSINFLKQDLSIKFLDSNILLGEDSENSITAEFIEKQDIQWLYAFYQWVANDRGRIDKAKFRPLFLNSANKAVPIYNKQQVLSLYLPFENEQDNLAGYDYVSDKLLASKTIKEFLLTLGVHQPDKNSYFYHNTIPRCQNATEAEYDDCFIEVYNYIYQCNQQDLNVIGDRMVNLLPIATVDAIGQEKEYLKPTNVYINNKYLKEYWSFLDSIRFVNIEKYEALVGIEKRDRLELIFEKLGVNFKLNSYDRNLERDDVIGRQLPYHNYYGSYGNTWTEYYVEGIRTLLEFVVKNKDISKSQFLWNFLTRYIREYSDRTLEKLLVGRQSSNRGSQSFDSQFYLDLYEQKWLVDSNGVFVNPREVSPKNLMLGYVLDCPDATDLIKKLEMPDNDDEAQCQRQKIAKYDQLHDIVGDAFDEVCEALKEKLAQGANIQDLLKGIRNIQHDVTKENNTSDTETLILDEKIAEQTVLQITDKTQVQQDIAKTDLQTVEYDSFNPRSVAASLGVKDMPKYSYAWFKKLLQEEIEENNKRLANQKEIQIKFSKIEKENGSQRTILLMYPNINIPGYVEELSDITLKLNYGNKTEQKVLIEVASVKNNVLKVKTKKEEDCQTIDFSAVKYAVVTVMNPIFLLEELQKKFTKLNLDDAADMQAELCENIKFIFGPPGTGKTTHLAKNVIIPKVAEADKCKILVLTPTNKAADVLCKRIIEVSGQDKSYEDWLVRFGNTNDEDVEKAGVTKDRSFLIKEQSKSVVVATVVRFAYDYFMTDDLRYYLDELDWDYIIIDEASMIPLVNIIYPLYRKKPKQFIIAGDPLQIEPIVLIDAWKDENIYSMVQLQSFGNQKTVPFDYDVELLTTQYRSLPTIGDVFSRLFYNGLIRHNREENNQIPLKLNAAFNIKTLNIIKYPVKQEDNIFKAREIGRSPYHVYSVLFIFEYVSRLADELVKCYPQRKFRIGIISPYKIEADIIDKLLTVKKLPKQIDIQTGTIHSFQGDECDMIFAVLNPPVNSASYGSPGMFLNKKNIINVAISRARDYLFVVMPDDTTKNIANMYMVKNLEGLMCESENCQVLESGDIENALFNDRKYIENNVFSTSHQNVNVYRLPEKKYEVRSEKNAIDIQIHGN